MRPLSLRACRGRLLHRDPPQGACVAGIDEGCGMEQRRIVPEHYVTHAVFNVELVFGQRRVLFQLVEKSDGLALGHAFDAKRAARDGIERLASSDGVWPR